MGELNLIGSSLVTKQIPLSGGYTKGRNGKKICRITPHHAAGYSTIESIANTLKNGNISATYVIQDNNIGQCISEEDRPWTSSSAENDNQAITVEISNSSAISASTYAESTKKGNELGWPISDESLESFVKLAVDIMKRYDFAPLVPGENLTWHSMFSATACPGSYLLSKMQYIADECNKRAFASESYKTLYGVVKQVIALSDKSNAEKYAAELNFNSDISKEYYKVIEI